MTRRPRLTVGLVLLAGLVLIVLIGERSLEPLDPDSTEPDGARALVMLLEEYASSVDVLGQIPGPEVEISVLLVDRLDDDAADALGAWVFNGGVLVVADPGSPFVPPIAEFRTTDDPEAIEITRGVCDMGDLSGARRVSVGGAVLYDNAGSDGHCFGGRSASFVDLRQRGEGVVISIGGAGEFSNAHLGEADNPVLAVALMAPTTETSVAVLRSSLKSPESDSPPDPSRRDRRVGDGSRGLFDLMPEYLRWVALDLALAWLIYAFAMGRRLGRPVPEDQPVDFAASELVLARGRLLRRIDSSATVGNLTSGLRTDLGRILGLPSGVADDRLVEIAASRSQMEAEQIMQVLQTVTVNGDRELVEFTRLIDRIRQEVQDD